MKLFSRLTVILLVFSISEAINGEMTLLSAQDGKTVTVTVSDEIGPVIGSTVAIKGTSKGVVTDLDGKAVLHNVPSGAVLQVSCLGYLPQEIEAVKSAVSIFLVVDSQVLDDVIVIGYGTAKRNIYLSA